MNNINDCTLGDLLENYPPHGVCISLTFDKEDLADLLNLYLSLDESDPKLGLLDHIITQIQLVKQKTDG
jgi:hypothetical protein